MGFQKTAAIGNVSLLSYGVEGSCSNSYQGTSCPLTPSSIQFEEYSQSTLLKGTDMYTVGHKRHSSAA